MHIPLTLSLIACAALPALDLQPQVDDPSNWWNPRASHHGMHFVGGGLVGTAAYAACRSSGTSGNTAMVTAFAVPAALGIAWEAQQTNVGGIFDPVDILWTAAGGICAGIASSRIDGWVFSPHVAPGVASLNLTKEF